MGSWKVPAVLFIAAAALSCATSRGSRLSPSISVQIPLHQVKVQEGVEISVQLMTAEQLVPLGAVVRPYRRVDFAPILEDDYVNYADQDLADLLTSYNLYQRYAHGLEADCFGQPLWLEGWRVNPYLSNTGRSPFLLFMVTVRNLRREKIAVAPLETVILDDQGHQHRALGREDLLAISETSAHPSAVGMHRGPLPSWAWVRQLYLKGDILRRTMLLDQCVFPQVTCAGLVAFQKFASASEGFQLVFPEVILFQAGEQFRTLDFRFPFSGKETLP